MRAATTRLLQFAAASLPPVLVALYVGATTFLGGTSVPWRPIMVDLDVYRLAGKVLLEGGDFYNLPGRLPFLYPPFAALLAVPLAVLPATLVQVAWTAAGAVALVAMLYRFGLTGWVLSLVATATAFFVQPVVQTLGFGQLGIFLVALVVLDLVPGPRVLPRRLLPEGVLTGLAAAIKLTPAIFLLYLLLAGRRRPFLMATAAAVVVTLLSAVVVPRASLDFWGRLAHGDTGLGGSIIYYTNQSVMADIVRILGLGSGVAMLGLAASAVVGLLGVWAAVQWHRLGQVGLAVNLCGVAGLLASPVSWLHHFVWVVPLGASLALAGRRGTMPLPRSMLVLGWLFVGWVAAAPRGLTDDTRRLPNGADLELGWLWFEHAVATVTAVVGTAFLVVAMVVGIRLRSTAEPLEERAEPDSVRGADDAETARSLPQSGDAVSGGSPRRGS
jgi:alpha-1,2-mannosyltransferase